MANPFTPDEIAQILEEFFNTVGTRQYIGARYVPILGRKNETSIEWDNTKPYEPLTIVTYQGNSYTSRQYVPTGVDINNQDFWVVTGNYNAQVEQYRQETARALNAAQNAQESADNAQEDIDTLLPKNDFSAENTVKDAIDNVRLFAEQVEQNLSDKLSKVVHVFNTADEMLIADDLSSGEICRTNGRYTSGDGGAAWYVLSEKTGEANNIDILNALVCFAIYVPINGEINAASLGCIGANASEQAIDRAISLAEENGFVLTFPVDFESSHGITLKACDLNIPATFTYTGSDSAIVCDNLAYHRINVRNINCPTGIGIKLYQHGDGGNDLVHHDVIDIDCIDGLEGMHLQATAWGIYECDVKINYIKTDTECIHGECLQASETDHISFIGQMNFDVTHMYCRYNGTDDEKYAVFFEATREKLYPDNTIKAGTVTGINFGETSFENSKYGLCLFGDCKMIDFQNLRVYEQSSFDKLINFVGHVFNCNIHVSSPVMLKKVSFALQDVQATSANRITGGVYSPTSYRFADEIIAYTDNTVLKSYDHLYYSYGLAAPIEFASDTDTSRQNWRIFDYLNINVNLNDSGLEYIRYDVRNEKNETSFHPLGNNKLLISQLKSSATNATVKIINGKDANNNDIVIFDGTTKTETGRHVYELTIYMQNDGTFKYEERLVS